MNSNIPKILANNSKRLQTLMGVACADLEGDMQARASGKYGAALQAVDFGNYKNSFVHKISQEGLTTIGRVGNSTNYGHYIEFGTGEYAENGQGRKNGWVYFDAKRNKFVFTLGMRPRPIMRTAAKERQKSIKAIFGVK